MGPEDTSSGPIVLRDMNGLVLGKMGLNNLVHQGIIRLQRQVRRMSISC